MWIGEDAVARNNVGSNDWKHRIMEAMRMKAVLMMALLLLGLALGREAQAFYNPSTGRWLSRDPIEERGGVNPVGFIRNNPVRTWDYLGLLPVEDFFTRAERCVLCAGIQYDPLRECCIQDQVHKDKATGTGVKRCSYRPVDPSQFYLAHTWVQWDGGSAGFNAPGNPGQWASPDLYSGSTGGGVSCDETELSPCKYDLEKFKNCIKSKASQPPADPKPSDCNAYAARLVGDCLEESKYP